MQNSYFILIYFFYGLAFFCMGLAILLELGHGSDLRLRHALRPLAGFGLVHGAHEWLEMFEKMGILPGQVSIPEVWFAIRLWMLAISFISLSAFGVFLLARDEHFRRISMLVPLGFVSIWGFGLLIIRGQIPIGKDLFDVAEVWTRYVLAIPSSMLACAGLISQQREFRRMGMAQFGRDSLWAAIAFSWYGIVGQTFTKTSLLPPSNFINQELFLRVFGIPVQLMRAVAAIVVAVFVMRFLRSFEVAMQRQIAVLQAERLDEARRRETMRGEMLHQIVAAQEAERQRIARELHDETGQDLTAIGLGLRGVATIMRQDADKAVTNLRQLEGLVTHSLTELQRLIADLRPSHLDDLGLPAALRWYTGEVQRRAPFQLNLDVVGEPRTLPSEVKTALFRVAQEAVTNIIRHANAKNAWIHLSFDHGAVSVTVEDDGAGFDLGQLQKNSRPPWGLLGMEERASLLGGQLVLDSKPGQGTRVQVIIPYPGEMEREDGNSTVAG